ncbi:MAG: hemin uptake protein HemP [Planctomycetaceae bacterium]
MPKEHPQVPGNESQPPEKKLTQNTNDCPEVQFLSLSNGHSELIIEHCGQKYRLIATRHGKLVLNK